MVSSVLNHSFIDNIKSTFNSVYKAVSSEFSVLLGATTNIMKGLEGIGAVAIGNPVVKTALSICSTVKLFFEAAAALPKTVEIGNLRSEMFEHVKDPNPSALRERRIQDLTAAATYISANHKRIRTILGIAKTAGLLARANAAKDVASTEDLEKGEEFVRNLRRRVDTKLGLTIAQLVTKVTGVALSAITLVIPSIPVTLILFGVVGLSALTLWGIEKIMLPQDPFGTPKDVWYETAPHKVRTAVYKVSDAIKDFFSPKKFSLQPAIA